MEVNIENKVDRKRLSIITDVIIFLILLNVFLLGFKFLVSNYSVSQNLSLEDIEISNKNYIESSYIEDNYNIKILYGDEAFEPALKVDANIQEDEYIIYENLLEIKGALRKYPQNFFEYNNLSIIILESFNNQNIALASRNKLNEFKIYLTNSINFERALHHEMYHVFEYKLNVNKNNIYNDWHKYNPDNFEYISNTKGLDDKYIYSKYTDKEDIYFVTKYSKTSEKEDRAEIFAEIMTFETKPDFLVEDCNIRKKAEYITTMMTVNLSDNNKRASFYWDRF